MAVTIKKAGKTSNSMADLLGTFQKDHGEGIGSFGGALVQSDRIPTGLFELDLAMGGGFPRGKVSIVFGPESSGKTNISLLAIASHQRLWPDKVCAFIDIEHSFDPDWAGQLGVDCSKLLVINPSFAEQAVDIIETLLRADDCGLIVVDSLAAFVTTSEIESSADKAIVGGASLVIGKLTRRSTQALVEAEKAGRYPSMIYINQVTFKIGVMFGDPETTPGGNKPRHQSAMTVRLYGKNKLDPSVSKTMPVIKETTFIIRKWKCPILHASGSYEMVTYPHDGLTPGMAADFNAIAEYLKTWGEFKKDEKKGWIILGQHYGVIEQFKTKVYQDKAFGNMVRQHVIGMFLNHGEVLEEGGKS